VIVSSAIFLGGLFAWTFLEYVIHGWMSHVYETFATPLHGAHHKDPSAVFTLGAWPPTIIVWLCLYLWSGWSPGVIFYSGVVCGFIAYEFFHYRIHYANPSNLFEATLRSHHLIHHMRRPDACFGVTTTMWDRAFGSELGDRDLAELTETVSHIAPLTQPSNLRRVVNFALSRI